MPCLTCGVPTRGKALCPDHAEAKAQRDAQRANTRTPLCPPTSVAMTPSGARSGRSSWPTTGSASGAVAGPPPSTMCCPSAPTLSCASTSTTSSPHADPATVDAPHADARRARSPDPLAAPLGRE
jgi:hypothetical protein